VPGPRPHHPLRHRLHLHSGVFHGALTLGVQGEAHAFVRFPPGRFRFSNSDAKVFLHLPWRGEVDQVRASFPSPPCGIGCKSGGGGGGEAERVRMRGLALTSGLVLPLFRLSFAVRNFATLPLQGRVKENAHTLSFSVAIFCAGASDLGRVKREPGGGKELRGWWCPRWCPSRRPFRCRHCEER